MVIVAMKDETATCRWPHPAGLKPLKASFPVAALEPAAPRVDVGRAWSDALKATEDLFRADRC